MALPVYIRSPFCLAKRLRLGPLKETAIPSPDRLMCPSSYCLAATFAASASDRQAELKDNHRLPESPVPSLEGEPGTGLIQRDQEFTEEVEHPQKIEITADIRLPRSVQAVYLRPLKREAKYGVPACDLQLRSYSVRNVEFFADFALRAAYYLHLPAAGPIPLPRITERWTVPRSNFIHKKSQENFERMTLRRLIQIQDGHPDTVEIWLAFLRKHAYYGVGMKANVWEYEKLGVGKTMDVSWENMKETLEPKWAHFGRKKNPETAKKIMELLDRERYRKIDDGPFNNV